MACEWLLKLCGGVNASVLKAAEKKRDELQMEVNRLTSSLSQRDMTITDAEQKKARIQSELRQCKADLTRLMNDKTNLEDELRTSNQSRGEVRKTLVDAESEVKDLTQQLKEHHDQSKMLSEEAKATITDLTKQQKALEGKLASRVDEVRQLNQVIQRLNTSVSAAKEEVSRLNVVNTDLSEQLEALNDQQVKRSTSLRTQLPVKQIEAAQGNLSESDTQQSQ